MRSIDLNVNKRDLAEKPRHLRIAGKIPGICYGAGGASVAVEVDAHEFGKSGLASHGAHLISFTSADPSLDKSLALLKDMQAHPVSGTPTHLDFLRLDSSKPVVAEVALAYVGKPAGAIEGGMVQPIRRELEVRALPSKLPEQIDVDVTALQIGDAIHVEDLDLGEGVEAIYSDNFTLVTVLPPVVEKAAEEEELDVDAPVAAAEAEDDDD